MMTITVKSKLGLILNISCLIFTGCNLLGGSRTETPISISPTAATIAVGTQQAFEATGGTPPYQFSLQDYLVLGQIDSSTGVYTAPSSPATNVVIVTDSIGQTAQATLTIVNSLAISATNSVLKTGEQETLSVTDGIPPYTFAITSGSGADISTSGVFTPAWSEGSWTVTVTDSVGTTASVQISRSAGPYQWGGEDDESLMSGVRDSSGNIFIAGNTDGNFSSTTSLGSNDGYIAKFDPLGRLQWIRQIGSTGYDKIWDLAIDETGNIYAVGEVGGTLAANTPIGGYDAFIISYDTNGTVRWSTQFGTTSTDRATCLVIDNTNDLLYIGGNTYGTMEGSSAGNYDVFVRQMSLSGTTGWTDQSGSAFSDSLYDIETDPSGYVYITGGLGYASTTTGSFNGQNYAQYEQPAFVVKYSSAGSPLWTILPTGNSNYPTYGYGLAADASGNIYVSFQDAGAMVASNWGVALSKLSTHNGTVSWSAEPAQNYTGAYLKSSLTLDSSFNPVLGTHYSNYNYEASSYFYQTQVSKFNKTNGSETWAELVGDFSNHTYMGSVEVDPITDNIFLFGFTNGSLGDFTNSGNFDPFIIKYNTDGEIQ